MYLFSAFSNYSHPIFFSKNTDFLFVDLKIRGFIFFWHWKHHFWTFQELSFSEHQKLSSNSKNSRRYNTLCRAHNLWVYIIAGSLVEEMRPAKIVHVSHSKGPNFLQNDAIHFFFFLNEGLGSILTPYKRKFPCGACVLFLRVLKSKTMLFCRMFQLCRRPPHMSV